MSSAPETPAPSTEAPPTVVASPPGFRIPALLVAFHWVALWIISRLELTTFVRFVSRMGTSLLMVLGFLGWWGFSRRLPPGLRKAGFAAAIAGGVTAAYLCDASVGVFGILFAGLPIVATTWTLWLLVSQRMQVSTMRAGLVLVLVLTWGYFTLIRMDGLSGEQESAMKWRWEPTAEELFLAGRDAQTPPASATEGETRNEGTAPLEVQPGDWPSFRGPNHDGAVRGIQVSSDWNENPPPELWRQRVGPAWSSMIVVDDRLFTQEQRGERETVVCRDAATGREIWVHDDPIRFTEQVAGAGPRATPAFAEGIVFSLGATGLLNALDAATGARVWSRDLVADTGAATPQWGFCSSPAIVDGVVIVFAGGTSGGTLVAYHVEKGEPAWKANAGSASYSSPLAVEIDGKQQVLFFSDGGLFAFDPASGTRLWEYIRSLPGAPFSVQPHLAGPSQVLLASEAQPATLLFNVSHDGDRWSIAERWATNNFKPSFNDLVIHEGFAYGFDGKLFACVDLATGKRRWKGGRYGHGQVVLLAEPSLLIVISESGEAVLLSATPERHEELGRFQAIDGKTWNHPAVAHGRLFVRNAEEMACFELRSPDTE